jgi:hypothetical protein
MSSAFNHSSAGITAGVTRTLAYGPVPSATTVIVFSGTLSNVDNTNQSQHWLTLESFDGANYTQHLNQVPIPWGSTSKVPKLVLMAGESLYITADAASSVMCRFEVLVRT